MKEDIPLYIPSEYVGLLVLAIHLIHRTPPNIYLLSKPVVYFGNLIVSWSNYRQLMVLIYLKHSIIILRDYSMSTKL